MSFLNRKNILSEGFFDILKKLFNNSKLSSQDKKLMKDPEFKKIWKKYQKKHKDTMNSLDATLKKQGIKSRF